MSVRTRSSSAFPWAWLMFVACLLPWSVHAQERVEKAGVVLYWGLVPSAVVSRQHPPEELHGGRPPGGGKVNHLVVALFDARSGSRIADAVVRAQLTESGIVDAPPKYLVPMKINEEPSYGQMFGMVHGGPFRFRLLVRLAGAQDEIPFDITAAIQLGEAR
jgi:hypothetical protein